ncbi:MAG TPA: carbon-nitrogen hydrolase family protein [Saprospiraceae bacterium]|nr:carbon-nitrogen hydrolase family protein [Saprospiraceae bacterium]HPI07627.1 carbon-nitrogen hydrolase family protein [Saprospiraceae bacterium]
MNVTVATAQYPVTYHADFSAWAVHTASWVQEAAGRGAQLLLFPEYGSMELVSLFRKEIQTDLGLQLQEMESLRDDFCTVFSGLAQQYGVVIAAPSFPVQEGNIVVNRCFVFGPKGRVGWQDKFFMTRFELESWNVQTSGPHLTVFEADWGCFGIQICYDVEFPVGAALLCGAEAQVLLAPSCTETLRGATRVHVGARARALEQQCYTVVSPLIGDAPWSPAVDVNFGYAAVYSTPDNGFEPEGILQKMEPQLPGWLIHTLHLSLLDTVRADGQTLNFRDQAVIKYGMARGEWTVERSII